MPQILQHWCATDGIFLTSNAPNLISLNQNKTLKKWCSISQTFKAAFQTHLWCAENAWNSCRFCIDWLLLYFLCYRQDFQMANPSICPGAVCQQWANHNSLRSFETNYQKTWKMDAFWLWILITCRSDFSIFLVIKNLKPNIKFLKKSLITPIKLNYGFPWDAEAAFSWFFKFHHFVSFPDLLLLNWGVLFCLVGFFVSLSV